MQRKQTTLLTADNYGDNIMTWQTLQLFKICTWQYGCRAGIPGGKDLQ